MSTATAETIRRYVVEEMLSRPDLPGDPLADGELDSLAVELLLAFIEDEFEIQFADEELILENFASIAVLAALVDVKCLASGPGADVTGSPPA